jgi:hypothetical protein
VRQQRSLPLSRPMTPRIPSMHASRISTMHTPSHIALASSDPRRTADLFVQAFGASFRPHAADAKAPPELTLQFGELKLVFVQGVGLQALGASHAAFNLPPKDSSPRRASSGPARPRDRHAIER